MAFGYCQDCQYWEPDTSEDLGSCSRINTEGVDVSQPESSLMPPEQRFRTDGGFGCSLFEALSGMDEEIETPEAEIASQDDLFPAEPGPQSLDEFLV